MRATERTGSQLAKPEDGDSDGPILNAEAWNSLEITKISCDDYIVRFERDGGNPKIHGTDVEPHGSQAFESFDGWKCEREDFEAREEVGGVSQTLIDPDQPIAVVRAPEHGKPAGQLLLDANHCDCQFLGRVSLNMTAN
jgi:hypothetical protein